MRPNKPIVLTKPDTVKIACMTSKSAFAKKQYSTVIINTPIVVLLSERDSFVLDD